MGLMPPLGGAAAATFPLLYQNATMARAQYMEPSMSKESTVEKVKALAAIVSQDQFATAVAELAEAESNDTAELQRAMKDAKTHLEGRGVRLPSGARVEITQNSPLGIRVCVNSHCITVSIHAV
jgi:hypothetical protein